MSEKIKMSDVTLKKPHKHAGQPRAAGDVIRVTEPEAAWLAARGVIESPAASRAAAGGKTEGLPGESK